MALRNRSQVVVPEQLPSVRPTIDKQPGIKRRKLITKQEKVLYLGFIIAVAIMAVVILHKQGEIQTATIDIQNLETNIADISKENENSKVQISEKSTFERIMAIAKEKGFTLNEDNVKVVPGE